MQTSTTRAGLVLAALLAATSTGHAGKSREARGSEPELPRIADKTRGMTSHEGLFRIHVDRSAGKVWLEVPPPRGPRSVAAEFLYVGGLRGGLGSNPVGLDRGLLGPTRWVALRRIGPRVLLEQLNPRFRADSDVAAERRAAAESFATSILWGEEIAALDPDGTALVDLTSFLIRDALDVRARLAALDEGSFALSPERSAVDLEQCLAFPDNVELEAVLTYAGTEPGTHVRSVAPTAGAITLVQHQSLIRLPDDGYRPRAFDPRAGSYPVEYQDYAAGIDAPLRRRWIVRHRLQKIDPSAASSPVRKPIVFYVDSGAPEPVRSALVEGASWWAEAFEAAGFEDAFRVEILPEGVHPLDVRYNVIQWVHRSTRGWSYGGGVVDPRTGEMLKGHVRLGSLRVRQDRLLFEGLAGTVKTGSGDPDDPVQLALARIRQLAAHEVGHALGLSHNFAASTYGNRASVMDYPAPLVAFDDEGGLDFSRAYGVGVGAWDLHAIRYAYSDFPADADESEALQSIVRDGIDAGLLFLTDRDARPDGASDPRANLWDNGDDPIEALDHTMRVRRYALEHFGEHNIRKGMPLAGLEEVLAPVYFHHRYQLAAAVKVLGGMEYHYVLRGDGRTPTRIVGAERQRRALDEILHLLDPGELDLPDAVLALLAPRSNADPRTREQFASATSPAFDVQQAAATMAAMVFDGLLQPERLGRLAEFHRRDPSLPGADELFYRLVLRVFGDQASDSARYAELERLVQSVFVQRLIGLAADESLRSTLRSRAEAALSRVLDRLDDRRSADLAATQHRAYLAAQISRFLDRPAPAATDAWTAAPPPPGSPIGTPPDHLSSCSRAPYPGG